VLITSQKKKHLFLIRSAKFRERIDAAVDSAQRASKYALQKADIAISRTATARGKAELADVSADHAKVDSEVAIQTAREFAPDFKPSLLERFERLRVRERFRNTMNDEPPGNKMKLNENQISPNQMTATNSNMISPNKTSLAMNSNQQQQQQQAPQQQKLLNPQPTIRRTSVNPMMRQPSIDYATQNNTMYANSTSNPVDYSNTLGHNQQFGQPQPPGNSSAFNTPQKFASQQQTGNSLQQNYNQQSAPSVSVQQSQHNQLYQNNASQYQPMNSHLQQQQQQQQHDNQNSYASYQQQSGGQQNYQQNYSDQQDMQGNMRRNSRQVSDSGRPMLGAIHQTSIDHFDHYKRPPSRDSSVDRYSRAASRLGGGSRQPSVDRNTATINPDTLIDRGVRAGSQLRGTTPAPNVNGSVLTGVISGGSGAASRRGSRSGTPVFQQQQQQPSIQTIQAQYSSPNQPFEDVLLRQRTLGQDIIPSPGQPKRTESLFVPNKPMTSAGGGGGGASKGISKVCEK
jgi:junctophilin